MAVTANWTVSNLGQALESEAARYRKALDSLEAQEEARLARVDAEMARRGLLHSDAHRQGHFEARLEKLNQAIDSRIEIRRELICTCPELGTAPELKRLMDAIQDDVARLRTVCQGPGLLIPSEVFSGLRERSQEALDVLRREAAFPTPAKPKPAAVSVNVRAATFAAQPSAGSSIAAASPVSVPTRASLSAAAGSPTAVDAAYRKAEEVLVEVEERNAKLAAALRRLAAAIKGAGKLADERACYLEQVHFIAEQAVRPPVIRRVSVVKGLFVALRAGLRDFEPVAAALNAAGPLMATHFGLTWPPSR